MTRSPTHRLRAQDGFTLIELLVVILIIGILAAVALPAFLGQRAKAHDSTAKTDARNLASQIEACWLTQQTYVGCAAELSTGTGLAIGSGPGQVQITTETATGYEIAATAEDSNHTFKITHNIGGVFDRTCTVAGEGGCRADGGW